MKKIVLGLLMMVSFYSNAQDTEFTFTADKGMTDFIVTPVEGKTTAEIYKKVIEWIKVTYKNPDKVILSTIENEYVRFEGLSETLWSGYPAKYEIEILIKDGKYRFDLISFHNHMDGWMDITVFNNSMSKEDLEKRNIFKKDNTLKNMFKFFDKIPTYFNNLNKSLSESIVSTVKKTDGW